MKGVRMVGGFCIEMLGMFSIQIHSEKLTRTDIFVLILNVKYLIRLAFKIKH